MPRTYFILGGVLATLGVILARIVCQVCFTGQATSMVYLLGIFLATAGLMCIALGFRQRLIQRQKTFDDRSAPG